MQPLQRVKDIMIRKVITAQRTSTITEIARLMHRSRIGSVVIIDGRKPVGIVTESDFIKLAARGTDMKKALARDYMNKNVVTCEPCISVIDALMVMRAEKIRHLPVVTRGRLTGFISLRDLIAATQFSSFYLI